MSSRMRRTGVGRVLIVLGLGVLTSLAAAWGWPILTFLPCRVANTHTAADGTNTFKYTMGFPLTCFECEEFFKHEVDASGRNFVSARHEGCFQVLRRESPSRVSVFNLAYRPVWPGAVVNPLFWCGVWGLGFWVAARVRREVRARRGACGNCGYDRRGLVGAGMGGEAACPECGAAAAKGT